MTDIANFCATQSGKLSIRLWKKHCSVSYYAKIRNVHSFACIRQK